MIKTVEKFAEFLFPGTNTAVVTVDEFDPYALDWPEGAYGVRFFTLAKVMDFEEEYTGTRKYADTTFHKKGSTVVTLEEARNDPRCTKILVENMETNDWKAVIFTPNNSWPLPWNPERMRILE